MIRIQKHTHLLIIIQISGNFIGILFVSHTLAFIATYTLVQRKKLTLRVYFSQGNSESKSYVNNVIDACLEGYIHLYEEFNIFLKDQTRLRK